MMVSMVTINDTTFNIIEMSTGEFSVYDASRMIFYGRFCNYAKAIEACEEMATTPQKTCGTCGKCVIERESGRDRHFCRLYRERLDSLRPCDFWEER